MNVLEFFEKYRDEDPEVIAREGRKYIDAFIECADHEDKQALQQLQWRIDGELRGIVDPVARMNKMVELFWHGVAEFHAALSGGQDNGDNR